MTLEQAIGNALKELPTGYEIQIAFSRDSIGVSLFSPDGRLILSDRDFDKLPLHEQVDKALEISKRKAYK